MIKQIQRHEIVSIIIKLLCIWQFITLDKSSWEQRPYLLASITPISSMTQVLNGHRSFRYNPVHWTSQKSVIERLVACLSSVYIVKETWSYLLLLLLSRFSRIWLCVTPETAAHQAPPSLGFSRQEHWRGLPFPSPMHESEKWSRSVVSNSQQPHGLQPTRLLCPWDFPGKSTYLGQP